MALRIARYIRRGIVVSAKCHLQVNTAQVGAERRDFLLGLLLILKKGVLLRCESKKYLSACHAGSSFSKI
ncbi:hypothetical protein [uncultured Dysgonomonas sp.]|uniref:hypothetical protein n=1 Tax=uncultured Dysgonomonas sp. TaxID=206096 RepID=UPI002639034D|nr:hypothetical protein [uncultured Dysgonomonas sp.]